ncbi:hypothetical protein Tco_0310024 [Tanacetum coccineum]
MQRLHNFHPRPESPLHLPTEEPVSSTGTLSSLQHLAKDFSFGDQFLNGKPSEADNEKTTANTEAESMASVTIQQDTSITPPMTSPVIDLVSRPHSPNVHWPLPTTTITTAATTTTTPSPPPPPPLPSGASGASGTTGASDTAQAPPPPPPVSSTRQEDQSTYGPETWLFDTV